MEISEAAELVEAIARSIKENPNQFHFEISITGTRATAFGGGTGLHVQVTGGEPGSTTVGFQSSIGQTDIQIAQKAATAASQKAMSELIIALNNLASELRSKSPDKKRIHIILESLKQSWVPNVITSVVANVITKIALG
jgi:hypothetical protein